MAKKKPQAAYLSESQDLNFDAGEAFIASLRAPAQQPELENRGALRGMADVALAGGRGAVQGVRMLTDLAGSDNAASRGLRSIEDFIGGLRSAQARQDEQEAAAILKAAENAGILDQVIAGAKAFAVAPVSTLAQAVGTSIPTIGAALIPGVGQAATAGRMAVALGLGAGQGAGSVKGAIYDEVKQELLQAGASPEEAERRALEASSYEQAGGKIATGAALGAAAGTTGVERAVGSLARGVAKEAPGMLRRVGTGGLVEAIPEAAQGAQEKLASNQALYEQGFDVAPGAGVVAAGTMEALAGFGMGAAAGVPRPVVRAGDQLRTEGLQPERGPFTRGSNKLVEAAAQKVDADPGLAFAASKMAAAAGLENATTSLGAAPERQKFGNEIEFTPEPDTGRLAIGEAPTPVAPSVLGPEQIDAAVGQMHQQAAADLQATRVWTGSKNLSRTPGDVIGREPDALAMMQAQADAERRAEQRTNPNDIREAIDETERRNAATRSLYANILPTDILNPKGEPFRNERAANTVAKREGGSVVVVEGGWAVRPKETDAPATGGAAGSASPDAGRGDRVGVLRDSRPADLPDGAGTAAVQGAERDGAAALEPRGSQPAPALSPDADMPTLKKAWSEAAARGDDEAMRTINGQIVALKKAPSTAVAAPSGAVMPAGLNVTFGGKTYAVESIEDAQRKWIKFQESADGGNPAGVSQVGNGIPIKDGAGRLVARVAYNGRAFDPKDNLIAEAPKVDTSAERVQETPKSEQVAPAASSQDVTKLASDATPKPAKQPAKPNPTWDAMLAADRLDVLKRAGWTEGSKSTQRMLTLSWDKMTDGQRERVGAAMTTAPAAPAQEQVAQSEDDYLKALFGSDAATIDADPFKVLESSAKDGAAKQKGDAERIRSAIGAEKKRAQESYDDWSGRTYKRNRAQVELRGDGPSNQASMSIGAINESRRRNAMDALSKEIAELDKFAKVIESDVGAVQVVERMRALYERASKIASEGNGLFKTADEQFQYMLLDDLKFRGPSGKGNVTSNGLSKAVLSAVKPAPAAPSSAAPTTQEASATGGEQKPVRGYGDLETIAHRLGIGVFKAGGGWHAGGNVVEIPDADVDVVKTGAVSPSHVFAHELGHAIMQKRGVSFQGFPRAEVVKRVPNWDDLIAASKAFRPGVHNHENDRFRKHALKPNEVMADAIGAVLLGTQDITLIRPLMQSVGLNDVDLGLMTVAEYNQRNRSDGIASTPAPTTQGDGNGQEVQAQEEVADESVAQKRTEENATDAAATHKDPGELTEPVTPAVVKEAITKAADKRDRKPSEMRADLLRMIDEAIPRATHEKRTQVPRSAEARQDPAHYVSFRVPGDGMFTVMNATDALQEFRAAVEKSPGFSDRKTLKPSTGMDTPTVERGSTGPEQAIKGMIDDGDPQAAVDYAAARGIDLAKLLKDEKTTRWIKVANLTPTAEKLGEFEPEAVAEPAPTNAEPSAPAQQPAAPSATTDAQQAAPSEEKAKSGKSQASKIDDFGEKLIGARKDYAAAMKDAMDVDVAAEPLSKSWPEPDYGKMLEGGADPFMVAFIHAARDEVPTKPQKGWKLKGWVDSVKMLRGMAHKLVSGDVALGRFNELLDKYPDVKRTVGGRAELYMEVGHDKSLKGITLQHHYYSLYRGQENVSKWVVEQKAKATAFSNWPRELGVGDTRDEALAQFKEKLNTGKDSDKPAKGQFAIYRKPGVTGAFIGKKIGREYIDLKKVDDVAAARKYLDEQTDKLVKALERYKDTPFERKTENQPRVGDDHRNGAAVTPEVFAQTFGFRGVQFGNYVEQGRRQSDLNEAFDGLMDLAAVLGVQPRALSLNGSLGLAFGARGRGGKNAPAAHFEPDNVVINLTKGGGPGSLAHEWWHSLDNYFARQSVEKSSGYVTGGSTVDRIRQQMRDAFRAVQTATQVPTLRRRAAELDKRKAKPYWNTPVELSARAFESYVIAKLRDQGASNDYLANIVDEQVWNVSEQMRSEFMGDGAQAETYPYPLQAELPVVRAAFDGFFKTVEQKADDAGNVAMFSRSTTTGPRIDLASAQALAEKLAADGLLKLNVVQSSVDLPPRLLAQLSKSAPDGRVRGVYFRSTDQVWMVADHIRGADEFVEVALHEAFHRGLGRLIPGVKPVLNEIWRTNQSVRKATAEQMRTHGIGREEAIEEALAKMAEAGTVRDLKGWPKLLEAIRSWLGKMARAVGIEMTWTDDMVADLVAAATREGLRGGVHVSEVEADLVAAKRAPTVTVDTDEATGAPVYATDDITIGFPQETERFEYVLEPGEKLVNYSIGPADGFDSYGFVELVIGADGIPKALADIEIKPELRGQAIGEKVMEALLGAHPGVDIEISNIVEGARGFWSKMGIPEQNRAAGEAYDGTLNYETFRQAQDDRGADRAAAGRGEARQGRDAAAEGGARGAGEEAQGLMLSRADPADMRRVSAQDLVSSVGGIFDFNRLGETKQDRLRTAVDGSRPFWLGALTRDQLADVYGKEIPSVKDYDRLTRAMENERSKRAQEADALYQEWAKLRPAANLSVSRIMADATLLGVDPDGEFRAVASNDAATEAERRMVHARISKEFAALPADAKAIYAKVKAFHLQTLKDLQQSLLDRIERQVEAGSARQAALTDIRLRFDKYLQQGPYFPLSRFGDYLVVATRDDGERVVAAYETAGEQQAAARRLADDGFTVKMKTAKTYSRAEDGAAGKFIGDVLTTIESLDMEGASLGGASVDLKQSLLDDVNQLFIRALPDLSYRKHFAHRKGTPGFSSDMMRGFASSAFHSASHIARLNHGDKMTFALRDAYETIERAPEGDFNKHMQVLNEFTKRHEAALNPNTHPIASFLNSLGFVMYLGLSPAAGLINLLQVPMVALPHIGARYGFGTASAAMSKAYKDIMAAPMNKSSGFNAAESLQLSQTERGAIKTLQDEGIIDLTQAHDLASATGLDTGNVARSKAAFAMSRAMRIVGWTFHVPEVMNRQVTALTAYRLEMSKSGNHEAALESAREAIKRTQFDYSASNRARYMQGNLARVVTQFKQYSQNMTYLLGRSLAQALRGETPEVRSIARRQLVATLGITFAMAGSLGLPGLSVLGGLIGLAAGAADDDDEPWDWKVEFRNLMADTFGKEVGEVISHGVPRALMPWDLSNRVGLSDMWFRDSGRAGDNPREAFAAHMAAVLGPTAGTILGWYTAADHMARGNYGKAAESIVPKFVRDPLKAARESSEGVTSYTGEPLMDVTAPEALGRLLGFAPARASEMYAARGAVMNAKTAIDEKRTALLGKLAKARMDGDAEKASRLQQEAIEWNRRNPEARITPQHVRQSIMARRRQRQNTEDGITLPKNRENLREIGRFANAA